MSPHQQAIPELTAVVITLNEREQLPGLLRALRFAGQVVVLDGGSTDGTAQLAARLGAQVAVHPFDDFAAQRNRALELVGTPWVLSIDADERPEPGLAGEVAHAVRHPRYVAYRVPIRSHIFGRPVRFGGTQDDRPVRLFRRDQARWQHQVHERLAVCGPVGELHHGLRHRTLPDLAAFLHKMHRYTQAQAQELLTQGATASWHTPWSKAAREVLRRLLYKGGLLDGPHGWAFCCLSGLSEWVLWRKVLQGQRKRRQSSWRKRRAELPCFAWQGKGGAGPWNNATSASPRCNTGFVCKHERHEMKDSQVNSKPKACQLR